MQRFLNYIPAAQWLPRYDRSNLAGDVTAGLTVAVMLIPQGMAYAMLAGLPPIVGLYASIFPLFVYALFGTSRQLAVGPVAMMSLLTATGVGALAEQGTAEYVLLAVVLMGMVGVLQAALGVFRLGSLVSFLSHPVISGFTSAAALIIGLSQLKHLLGASIPRAPELHVLLFHVAEHIGETRPLTLLIGVAAIGILLGLKRVSKRIPGALIVVVLGTLVTWGFGLTEAGVAIVGAVPAGLPSPSVPSFSLGQLQELLPTALAISLVGFMESISVAKAFARKNRYEVDANQELIGLGLANVVGFFFGGYPVTGGFSRTAVNAQAGSKTPLASMITAAVIAVSLLFLTPLFYYLPKAVLAAIVMTAVFGLVDFKEPLHLWKVKRTDAILLTLTFLVTLFVGIEPGIGVGVAASLALFVLRSTRPHNAVLGRLPGTDVFRNVKNFPEAEPVPGMVIWRFDASFYFANADFFRDQVDRIILEDGALDGETIHTLLVDASGINDLDASAVTTLEDLDDRLARANVKLAFANLKGPVREVMERGHFLERLGDDRVFLDVPQAVAALGDTGSRPRGVVRPAA
jgi:SulP family sulfate permease